MLCQPKMSLDVGKCSSVEDKNVLVENHWKSNPLLLQNFGLTLWESFLKIVGSILGSRALLELVHLLSCWTVWCFGEGFLSVCLFVCYLRERKCKWGWGVEREKERQTPG